MDERKIKYEYQWYRSTSPCYTRKNGVKIEGATSESYELQKEDAGCYVYRVDIAILVDKSVDKFDK